jgi:hypothetical protein
VARFNTFADVAFNALYGNIENPHAVGKAEAGQILGYVNSYNYFHFGIHPVTS